MSKPKRSHPQRIVHAVPLAASSHKAFSSPALTASAVYRCAIGLAILIYFAHIVALPIGITYDGHQYIDMADILGSNRFPNEWNFARTPLYPLFLKAGFWALGRQPLAPIVISSVLGLIGVLALGSVVGRISGKLAGSAAVVLLALFPTLVAYEHFVLTEAGTFCFLALTLWFLLRPAWDARASWLKVAGLVCLLTAGFYWRQSILAVAPAAALFQGWETWKRERSPRFQRASLALVQILIIVAGPLALASPWSRYTNDSEVRAMMLKAGILKQALLSPDDPYLGENAAEYNRAIATSIYEGHFYGGIRPDLLESLKPKIYSKPMNVNAIQFEFDLIRRNPRRYAEAVGRTLLLFAGAKGQPDEGYLYRAQLLSTTWYGSKIGSGPPGIEARVKEDFRQNTNPSFILSLFAAMISPYDHLLLAGCLLTFVGLIAATVARDPNLAVLCAFCILYVLPFAVTLNSIDRYAFPVHPLAMTSLFTVPTLVWKTFSGRLSQTRTSDKLRDRDSQ
jgi:4-amino-4-deoxy-L-arabinose transferase-like glycosyltransferase